MRPLCLGFVGLVACGGPSDTTGTDAPPVTGTSTPPTPTSVPTVDSAPADAPWVVGAPLRFPRQEHAVAVLGDEVVVVAGVDEGPVTGGWVQAYHPATDQWRDLPELPVDVHHPNVASIDGALYLLGALDASFGEQPHAYVLPPGGAAWEPLGPPPADRVVGSAGVAVLDGQVHLVGGLQGRRSVALHTVYDPATDTWAALPDAPSARDHLAVGVVGDQLIATAGRDGGLTAFVDATEIYTAAGGWVRAAPIPTPRGGVAAAVAQGRLHVFGGEGSTAASGVFDDHEIYDPATDRWTSAEPMPVGMHGMGAALVGDTLWVPGGAPVDQFGADDLLQGYRP